MPLQGLCLRTATPPSNELEGPGASILDRAMAVELGDDVTTNGMVNMRKPRPLARLGTLGVTAAGAPLTMALPD